MKRWQALAAVAGVFVLGIAGGALGAHLYYSRSVAVRPPGPPAFGGPFFARQLHRQLDLSPGQAREIDLILADSRRQAETLRRDMAPRLRAVMEDTNRRIVELLSPEQQQRFEQLRHRHRRRAERFLHGRGGPRHPRHQPPGGPPPPEPPPANPP